MTVPWLQLKDARCFEVSGRDARRYLHNRLSNDIRALSPGQAVQAAALSAQGRVEGLFEVLCLNEGSFVLVSDGGDSAAIQTALGRFIVADRVTIREMAPPTFVVHMGGADSDGSLQEKLTLRGAYVLSISTRRISESGVHIVLLQEALTDAIECIKEHCGEALDCGQYEYLRWRAGIPTYPSEVSEEVILTECGMREALSFTKGCYVGQEVIERSDAIGRLPRNLERVVLTGRHPIARDAKITDTSGSILGKVLSVVSAPEREEIYLFVLLKSGKYSRGNTVGCEGLSGTIV